MTAVTTGIVPANGIELAYETFGDPSNPTVLLIMGLGAQMITWPDDFCQALVAPTSRCGFTSVLHASYTSPS